MKGRVWFLVSSLALSAFIASVTPVRAAGTWYVDGTTGNDANTCTSGVAACMTIQAAVGKATAGDTIIVAAGLYPEPTPVTVNKTLTLLGAQQGVDARGARGSESILMGPDSVYFTASNVVFDGFTVEGVTQVNAFGYGILMGAGTTGAQVLNNIVQFNIVGIGLANTGASQSLIKHNLIRDNNQPGAATGDGIYTDQFVSGGAVSNVLINENTFTNNSDAGIDISNNDATMPVSSLDVSTNSFDGNGRAILYFNTHSSSFHNNNVTNSTFAGSAAIRIFDNNSNLSIMNNNLVSGKGMHGIRFSDSKGMVQPGPHPSSNVVINKNNIGATSTSFTLSGLTVDSGSHVGTVNAICNWWGSAKGPANISNPGGDGEAVAGDANFKPWWTMPSQQSQCPAPPKCEPGKEDHGNGDVQDGKGHHAHMNFDECDEDHQVNHQDADQNVDFHSDSSDHSAPQFDANLPTATTTGHGWNNGKEVNYVLVVTQLGGPGLDLYSLTLSDATGVIYTFSGTVIDGGIAVSR
jgi:hypothetical protein